MSSLKYISNGYHAERVKVGFNVIVKTCINMHIPFHKDVFPTHSSSKNYMFPFLKWW